MRQRPFPFPYLEHMVASIQLKEAVSRATTPTQLQIILSLYNNFFLNQLPLIANYTEKYLSNARFNCLRIWSLAHILVNAINKWPPYAHFHFNGQDEKLYQIIYYCNRLNNTINFGKINSPELNNLLNNLNDSLSQTKQYIPSAKMFRVITPPLSNDSYPNGSTQSLTRIRPIPRLPTVDS